MEYTIHSDHIAAFAAHLHREEKSPATIEKYLREVRAFAHWLGRRPVQQECLCGWKAHLTRQGRCPGTVNGCLASLHSFFSFLGWTHCRTRYLKVQRQLFRDNARELTREEYLRLVQAAESRRNLRLSLLLQTICATGVRVSEVRSITVEAARRGRADIALKGKIRTILIPARLAQKLLKYAQKQKIASGEIFLTASGKSLSRRQIWSEMKRLCVHARVSPGKVFPHNLRHIFARAFYRATRDIVKLADILGHSSIETTRIYLISTGAEHARQLEKLHLIL